MAMVMGNSGHGMRKLHLRHHARPLAADDIEGEGATVPALKALALGATNAVRYRREGCAAAGRTAVLENAVAVALTLAAPAASRAQTTEIKVSYQPALYWALPFFIATEKNWWAELGLKPVFSTFPAGVPQIAASASKSWDIGGTGSVPAVLGKVRFNLLTIGQRPG